MARILIAPDKFKGSLTAIQAAEAIASGWRRARRRDQLTLAPISDGGDGFGAVMARLSGASEVRTKAVNAGGEPISASWWWDAHNKVAIVESARVIGLAMLELGRFHPFQLDTRGLGRLLRAAEMRGARRCVIGIGGSATNDGGFGLARDLGWRFFGRNGREIDRWPELVFLRRVERPTRRCWPKKIIVAVDVHNPLLGARGCTRVYGPQKGLGRDNFRIAEAALRQLAKVMRQELGADYSVLEGAGAAGGLGFGLAAFVGAQLTPGFELISRKMKLKAALRCSDLVVTGEGRLDRSSLMGKGTGEIAVMCKAKGISCIGFSGQIADRAQLQKVFPELHSLSDITTPNRATAEAKKWLEKMSFAVASKMGHMHQ